jgi:hypothetical protein
MKKWIALPLAALFALGGVIVATADYTVKDASSATQTILAFVCSSTKICPAHVIINSSGTELATSSNPLQVSLANTAANSTAVKVDNSAVTQPVSVADGSSVALGAKADSAWASGSGSVIALLKSIATNSASPAPAGTNVIGKADALVTNSTGVSQAIIGCDSTAVYDASTSGSTQLVALTSGKTIYVCGYSIVAGGTVNVKLIYGTGSACATGTASMTPAYQLTAQAGIVDKSPFYSGLKTAASNALCINASGAVAAQAIVYYTQF